MKSCLYSSLLLHGWLEGLFFKTKKVNWKTLRQKDMSITWNEKAGKWQNRVFSLPLLTTVFIWRSYSGGKRGNLDCEMSTVILHRRKAETFYSERYWPQDFWLDKIPAPAFPNAVFFSTQNILSAIKLFHKTRHRTKMFSVTTQVSWTA